MVLVQQQEYSRPYGHSELQARSHARTLAIHTRHTIAKPPCTQPSAASNEASTDAPRVSGQISQLMADDSRFKVGRNKIGLFDAGRVA